MRFGSPIRPLLELLGATGRTLELASFYLVVLVPTLPILSLGMTSSAVLRSVGDARRAMHVTLSGAIVNTILDLVFIVHFGLGLEGAVLSSLLARIVIMGVGFYGVISVHDLMGRRKSQRSSKMLRPSALSRPCGADQYRAGGRERLHHVSRYRPMEMPRLQRGLSSDELLRWRSERFMRFRERSARFSARTSARARRLACATCSRCRY